MRGGEAPFGVLPLRFGRPATETATRDAFLLPFSRPTTDHGQMDQPDSPAARPRPPRRTRQYREFEPTPVDQQSLDALIDVARWTGSSRNTQPWRFIVVTDPSTLRA